jgi:hypothetical protein
MDKKVVWHDHVFPSSQPWQSDDERCRFDAVEFEDGTCAVTDPRNNHKIKRRCKTRNEAQSEALWFANRCWTEYENMKRRGLA